MPIVNEMANAAELTVEKRVEGTYKLKRILLWISYFAVPFLLMCLMMAFNLGAIALIVFIPIYFPFLLPKIVYPALHRYVQIEYEYNVISGGFLINYIYGRKTRTPWLESTSISAMEIIAPYSGQYKSDADKSDYAHRYEAVAYKDHPDNYYVVFKNEAGESCVAIFQMTNKVLKLFAFHNKKTVISTLTA